MSESMPIIMFSSPAATASEFDHRDGLSALVGRAKQGDPAALAALYQRFVGPIYRFAYRRLADREAAEDATSAIFLRAFAALPTCRHEAAFAGWIFAIARRVVIDHQRERQAVSTPLTDCIVAPRPGLDPELLAIQAEDQRMLWRAREHCLSDDERQLFDLLLTDLNDKEIAMALGRTHGATRTAHWRLIRKLRDCLRLRVEDGGHE